MGKLENEIAKLIREFHSRTGKFLTIATVESATGGRIADKITNVAGSSDYFTGSIVSYSNQVKADVIGVREDTLKLYGAVSYQTAEEMAQGGRKLLKSDICISTTGIAGPGGATPDKPVGLFYIGISSQDTHVSQRHIFSGSRQEIKSKASEKSLQLLQEHLKSYLNQVGEPLEEKHVVTCFLEHNGLILILRRSAKVGTYKRAWAGVSGYMETEDALAQAYTEIREETGLFKNNIRLVKQAEPLEIVDKALNRKWIVHPFLFHVLDPERIRTDWEHTEFKWIKPEALPRYNTVPELNQALRKVI